MEGCLTRLVPVDINRSGKAPGSVCVLCLACFPLAVSLWAGGLGRGGTARRSAACCSSPKVTHPVTQSAPSGSQGTWAESTNRVLMEVVCGGLARQMSRACGWGCGHDLFCRLYLEHLGQLTTCPGQGVLPCTRYEVYIHGGKIHIHSTFSLWHSLLVRSELAAAAAHTRRQCRGWGRRDHGISRHCKTETEPVAVMLIVWAGFWLAGSHDIIRAEECPVGPSPRSQGCLAMGWAAVQNLRCSTLLDSPGPAR